MASKTRILCDACGRDMGLWQASFTSECAHMFHLRCVSGRGACPECKAQWKDTPAVAPAPAPAPATPFSFAWTPASSQPSSAALFGQHTTAAASSFGFTSSPADQTSLSGWSLQTASSSSLFGSSPAFGSSSSPSLFGSLPAFGSSSSPSLFGSPTATTSSFRCSSAPDFQTSLSGWSPQTTSSYSLFGSSPVFGSSSSTTSSSSLFGSSSSATSSPSLFGSSTSSVIGSSPQTTSRSSPFSFTIPSSTPSFGTSLFGLRPTATPNPFWPSPVPPTADSCSVCHSAMGRGQATVTSECNHTFHLRCFSGSVCPVCAARWRDEVTVAPPSQPNPFSTPWFHWPASFTFAPPNPSPTPPSPSLSSSSLFNFNDDEAVDPPLEGWDTIPEVAHNGVLVLTTQCEHPAVARDAAHDNFAVLVHAKAPVAAAEASARAPLDLVTVLDVSGSMEGPKLALLKQAMGFVIDKLGPGDRLSVVTFSCNARRIIRLTRMSEYGKVWARAAVESLRADSSTNIGDGLRVAAQVLDGRRHRNAVASIILLSDGQDNTTMGSFNGGVKSYVDLVPHSLRRSSDNRCLPVHTFGFGTDHDAAAMHAIAEVAGGTFSFIENQEVVQDSFAQCIGGLLSVAVQEARISLECLHPGVRVRAVKSGCYRSRVDADGRTASVDVGELYAEEERRFLLFVGVPVAASGDGIEGGDVTSLIKGSCAYKDAATGRSVDVAGEDAVVQRPVVVAADTEPSMDVARERFRVETAEDIASARAAAERGQHAEAARILDRRREASVAAGLAGDERCAALVAELGELSARVADRREYEHTGRAFMLAGMSSHAQQRASTVQLFSSAGSRAGGFGAASAGNCSSSPAPFGATGSCFAHQAQAQAGGFNLAFGAAAAPAMSSSPFASSGSHFADAAAPSNPFCSAAVPPFGAAASCFTFGYATPAMQSMVDLSRKTREQQQQAGAATATKGDSL